jgi:hypothetical protein
LQAVPRSSLGTAVLTLEEHLFAWFVYVVPGFGAACFFVAAAVCGGRFWTAAACLPQAGPASFPASNNHADLNRNSPITIKCGQLSFFAFFFGLFRGTRATHREPKFLH